MGSRPVSRGMLIIVSEWPTGSNEATMSVSVKPRSAAWVLSTPTSRIVTRRSEPGNALGIAVGSAGVAVCPGARLGGAMTSGVLRSGGTATSIGCEMRWPAS